MCGRPAGQPAGCSAWEGARALHFPGGGTGGPSPRWAFPAGEDGAPARLAGMDWELIERTVASLHDDEPTFDWVGVYLLDEDTLILGPYQGLPTEHERIPLGRGVCGSVAATARTEVVPDVRRRPGHIACDIDTRSEVVAPILRDGRILGVLDVDSNTPDAFGAREIQRVEEAAASIAAGA